ncbi:R2 Retrovirus-related Pol polyprotein from type I retrotransposable element [Triplophysa tibetana]|uniref:R2 Retrovirus-related Pol polyprotein from type I retrotransposable element n=1 Tax=Triplophysa tibetana TaxID=1572043 RepID=A0A5A9NI35_9TELE|nr:R2 Retrovirus-related Pol polyprotein from type I retrotransposable element [Triplophysa tibetana]
MTIPLAQKSRFQKLLRSPDSLIQAVTNTKALRVILRRTEIPIRVGKIMVLDSAEAKCEWANKLISSFDGRELSEPDVDEGSHLWLRNPERVFPRLFIRGIQLRGGTWSTKARASRGRSTPEADRRCRGGCHDVETLNHILQRCARTHDARCARHNRVMRMLCKKLHRCSMLTSVEPIIPLGRTHIKPDIVVHRTERLLVLDVTVVSGLRLRESWDLKLRKYGGEDSQAAMRAWLSRKRRRASINSTPAEPPVPRQNVPLQASQPVDFYTEDALGGDATEACNSILAEISEAILTNNLEVVTSSGDQGATATEGITVAAKSSVDLPSNQYHFNHELLLGISEKLGQLQETLNIHSEIARRMYGCVDTLLSNSADQGALNRLLLDRTENIQGTLQRIVQSHEDDCSQKQLMMRSVRGKNEHLSLTEQLQEMLDEQIEVFGGDYRNFDMDLQSLDLPEIIDEPSSPNICEIIEEIIEMQDLDFERRSNMLQTGDGEINNSAEQTLNFGALVRLILNMHLLVN